MIDAELYSISNESQSLVKRSRLQQRHHSRKYSQAKSPSTGPRTIRSVRLARRSAQVRTCSASVLAAARLFAVSTILSTENVVSPRIRRWLVRRAFDAGTIAPECIIRALPNQLLLVDHERCIEEPAVRCLVNELKWRIRLATFPDVVSDVDICIVFHRVFDRCT